MTEETRKLLETAIGSALGKSATVTAPSEPDAISSLAKAVEQIANKVDVLSQTAVFKEVETPETKVEKLSKSIEELTALVAKVAKGEKIEEEKVLPKTFNELNAIISKSIEDAIKSKGIGNAETPPKGEGSDGVVEKTVKTDEGIHVDLSSIETSDSAGNVLTQEKRTARKQLDDYFIQKIAPQAFAKSVSDDDDDDDDDSDE